jgi:hypothetical protein
MQTYYQVEHTSVYPYTAVSVGKFIQGLRSGGSDGWLTCGHKHKTFRAAVKCGRAINRHRKHPNENEFVDG